MVPTSQLSCTSNIFATPTCTYTNGILTVRNIFGLDYPAGSNITVMLNSISILVTGAKSTTSWNLTTYSDDNYMIDRIDTGLNFTFLCNSPCLTCPSNNPSGCLSCNTATSSNILYNGNCYDKCPAGTYFFASGQTCFKCSEACLTCSQYDGDICTSCNQSSAIPYLNGNTCSDKCAYGYYGDIALKKCI